MVVYKGVKLTIGPQLELLGNRNINRTFGSALPEINMKDYGERVYEEKSGKHFLDVMSPFEGKRINQNKLGQHILDTMYPFNGERINKKTSGQHLLDVMHSYDSKRIKRKTIGQELSNVWYQYVGKRMIPKTEASFLPTPFVLGGVRGKERVFEGIFQQNQYISEEQIQNQALPRKEPLESPWKKRTYSKNNLN
ncbi:hypothetical protein [Bacillus cereus group sp. MYBK195-1]|uniref:hypothetical protein n=1 Tax=Bacillus cereus group sp. MYBK195-1 TaxID=3450669 RepID=UPI003F7A3046|nr:hypothetical protein [Bacillus cereus]MDA2223864.1 hypothetical protein [Bacillus cereus]MDA2251885.1 hypothetical protein [Bacillus cereus]MDA2279822.1 hypothetical protein [Bacillus cereus]MDA2285436.1 hypothetical protein [Bacillus cereus]